MTEETPPTPLPPAAESPYPDNPAPHPQRDEALDHQPEHVPEGPAIGALGVTLIGGAVAAAVGLLVAVPLFRRKAKAKTAARPRSAPQARRPRRKRSD
jgi:hypothetical protein